MQVVFDTNTVISALLFNGSMRWLIPHWQSALVTPVASQATAAEFLRVLTYPKFGLTSADIELLAARYLPFVKRYDVVLPLVQAPVCRDKHDQKFIDLAIVSQADILVTGDADLIALSSVTPFAIETPTQYYLRFNTASN